MEANSEPENPTNKFRDFGKTSSKRSDQNKLFWAAGIIVLVLMIGIFFLFSKKTPGSKTTNLNTDKSATSSSTQKSNFCSSGQEFKSVKQGFDVCFPIGWVTNRDLSVSDLQVGFDPTKTDSTNPGLITVQISDKSEDQSVQDISTNSTKFEYSKFTVDSVKGTQIVYTKAADVVNPQAIDTVVVNQNRTYTISLNSSTDSYKQNKDFYDNFIASWKFIKGTPKPPWSNSGNILVKTPWTSDTVKNPIEISGEAIAFEGTVNIRIKDSKGHTLVETTVQAQSGVERSKFSGQISFNQPSTKTGTVEVYTLSAKDGGEQDKVTVSVVFP